MRYLNFLVLATVVAASASKTASAQTGSIANDATSASVFSFSIVEDGLPDGAVDGGDNVYDNPLFVNALGPDGVAGTLDDDLRLDASSPAIDAGSNERQSRDFADLDGDGDTDEAVAFDVIGSARTFDGGVGSAVVDMGAHEFAGSATGTRSREVPQGFAVSDPFPNPFSLATNLNVETNRPERFEIDLFDALGRKVRNLFSGTLQPSKTQTIRIDGTGLASGLYLVRIDGTDTHEVKTILRAR